MSIGSIGSSAMYQSPFQRLSIGQPGNQSNPMDQLKKVDSKLADQLQSFKDQADSMKKSGASADQIHQAMQADFKSLTADQKSEMKTAGFGGRRAHAPHEMSSGGASSGALTDGVGTATLTSNILQNQPVQNSAIKGLLALQSQSQNPSQGQDADGDGDSH